MITNRQNEIVEFLKEKRHAKINEIAEHFYISEATARRELVQLERLGLIHRDHGGAAIADNADDISIVIRQILRADSKLMVAQMTTGRLPEFKTVFIDNSSTALVLAQRLNFKHKTVVTNGTTVAMQLAKESDTKVYLLGGRYNYYTGAVVGNTAVKEIEQMQFHLMLCSCTSVSAKGAFESSADQRDVKRAALLNSRYKILLADSTKFNDDAMFRTCALKDVDAIYTNAPDDVLAPLREMEGVRIFNHAQG